MCKIDRLNTLSLSVSLSQLFELVFLLFASVCVRHEIIKLFVCSFVFMPLTPSQQFFSHVAIFLIY